MTSNLRVQFVGGMVGQSPAASALSIPTIDLHQLYGFLYRRISIDFLGKSKIEAMNTTVNELYAKYLDHTNGNQAAAAALTLADAMQRTLDAPKAEPPTPAKPLSTPEGAGVADVGYPSLRLLDRSASLRVGSNQPNTDDVFWSPAGCHLWFGGFLQSASAGTRRTHAFATSPCHAQRCADAAQPPRNDQDGRLDAAVRDRLAQIW